LIIFNKSPNYHYKESQLKMSKNDVLLLAIATMLTGLLITSLSQPLQAAYSQTDYEEYIVMESVDQSINQQNTGSGSSTNINCGANTAGTNLAQPITCPNVPGETPSPGATIPVVTQRAVSEEKSGGGVYSVWSPCNADEVVTGGGYDFTMLQRSPTAASISKEFAVDNGWYVETSDFRPEDNVEGTITVCAECLKLVPSASLMAGSLN
jgi:hypothetical protein